MQVPHAAKIFVSYAHSDGADLAQRLVRDLAARGLEPWLDGQRLHGGAVWTTEIESALDDAEFVLALLSHGSFTSEICRAEQLRALRKGKCVIPLLVHSGSDVPLYLEPKQYVNFAAQTNYARGFEELLESIGKRDGVVLKEDYRNTYVTAPPLPVNFVERPAELAMLRDAVIADGGGRHVALTALHGMGGLGKTILAQALCADEVVQQAFPDGVIWVSVGKESGNLVERMREVGKGLNDDLSRYDTSLGAINQYRTALRNKAALIVLDDVWSAQDVEPFRADSKRSRLLFTTRDSSIAATVGAHEVTANLLSEEQSRAFLAQWSGVRESEFPPQAPELIRECGRLPLALSMIGATLLRKPTAYWKGVLDLLRNAHLDRIKFPDNSNLTLFRAIQISVDELDSVSRERYLALAVLLEDMAAELPVMQTLWNASEFEALETSELFISRSLAARSGKSGAIALHDLQLDYVRAQVPYRDALPLIHSALRLSSHVLSKESRQFAGQMRGRLLPYAEKSQIASILARWVQAAPRPWINPLWGLLYSPGGALVRTLEGHSSIVSGVAMSGDGRRAISASLDNTLKVWDVETGREVRTLEGHSSDVKGVALSGDGRRAVSASWDYTLKVWDVETGREERTLEGHSSIVSGVAMSGDGRRAVSASRDYTLKVWDVETGREERTLEGHSSIVSGVAMSGDGRRAVSASWDKTLRVWDVETGRAVWTLEGHSEPVTGVALSGDGRRAVSASDDKTLKVWDVETGREVRTLEGHSSDVTGVALSGDGLRAVSASDDKTLKVWDVETGRAVRTLAGHSEYVTGVALSGDGLRAVSASWDKTLKVWDVETGGAVRTLEGHSEPVRGVALSGDGRRAVSASRDKTLKVWDVDTGRAVRTLEGHSSLVNGVALSGDGRRAVSASWDKTLKVWDVETGRAVRTLAGHSEPVTGVALSGDGRRAVSASDDKTLKVWDVETGREVRTLEGHSSFVKGVALSGDGRRAVSASWDKTLKVWDVETGRAVRTLEGHSSFVKGVALSEDGRRAVSASWDKTLKVWDVETGQAVRTLKGHSSDVNGVALSGDGRRAVSASPDKTLKVWDVETGQAIATFTCDAPVQCCAWDGSGPIVAGDRLGNVHFLTLELDDE